MKGRLMAAFFIVSGSSFVNYWCLRITKSLFVSHTEIKDVM